MMISKKIAPYLSLCRLDKPIGILLLLWPTLWALWLASAAKPDGKITIIFVMGVILMRSAGCAINDIVDRNFDRYVQRTAQRPLATGVISIKAALLLVSFLLLAALILVLQLNHLTIYLAILGLGWTCVYPFLKRITHLPQLGLGIAFAWGVPMAFAALTNSVPLLAWQLFLIAAIWPVIYDTFYAMVDLPDDIKIGVKSTAILFGDHAQIITLLLQLIFCSLFFYLGLILKLRISFYIALALCAILFGYQQYLIKDHQPKLCFRAFLNNHWIGLIIFVGIILGLSS
jgi:4-hydroxybenzoate polyprenyltransferase